MDNVSERSLDESDHDFGGENSLLDAAPLQEPVYGIEKQQQLRQARAQKMAQVGIEGYFSVLKKDRQQNDMLVVPPDADSVADSLAMAEVNLNMANVRTIITTSVYFGQPNNEQKLLSERLLSAVQMQGKQKSGKIDELRTNFFS